MDDTALHESPVGSKDPLASLAGLVRHASTGTLARLRRTDPSKDAQSSLFEIERMLQGAGISAQGEERRRWALVLHCLALVQGRHDPRADAEPGQVLQRLRFSEARLRQLVEADEPLLSSLMPRLARRLAVAGVTVNWRPLATLLLCSGSNTPQHEALAESARQRLVRHYLMAQAQGEGMGNNQDPDSSPAEYVRQH